MTSGMGSSCSALDITRSWSFRRKFMSTVNLRRKDLEDVGNVTGGCSRVGVGGGDAYGTFNIFSRTRRFIITVQQQTNVRLSYYISVI